MTVLVALGIGVLGGAGAVLRVLLDSAVRRHGGATFPFGTLAVNVLGSLLAGVVVGLALGDEARDLLGQGLLGAFTTFSTWAVESHRLAEARRPLAAAANIVVSLALGLVAAWAGRELGLAL